MEPLCYIDSQDKANFRVMRIVSLCLQCVLTVMLVIFTKQALRLARRQRAKPSGSE